MLSQSPSPVEKGHMLKQNLGRRLNNSFHFPRHLIPTALLSPHGSSLFTPEAALLRVGLCPFRWQLLLVMAAGRKGQDPYVFRLLWKEAVALKVYPGSQSLELWS